MAIPEIAKKIQRRSENQPIEEETLLFLQPLFSPSRTTAEAAHRHQFHYPPLERQAILLKLSRLAASGGAP